MEMDIEEAEHEKSKQRDMYFEKCGLLAALLTRECIMFPPAHPEQDTVCSNDRQSSHPEHEPRHRQPTRDDNSALCSL
jgi:hypothetical protein